MSFKKLKSQLECQLRNSRGDHGWWLITRVHLTPGRIRDSVEYLYHAGFQSPKEITVQDYQTLAGISEISREIGDPGSSIRRHLFLAMDTPLRLIERTRGNRWKEIKLTDYGVRLATESDPLKVFEDILSQMVFCNTEWFTKERVVRYEGFSVRPYCATLKVMAKSEGWIDRDEYDLFVSRILTEDDCDSVINKIKMFRKLEEEDKKKLRDLVAGANGNGGFGAKSYSNWRDMGLHTFSFFSLGYSVVRVGQTLRFTSSQVTTALHSDGTKPMLSDTSKTTLGDGSPKKFERSIILQIPSIEDDGGLSIPPAMRESNVGSEAELLVGKLLVSAGWNVRYYSHRRGFGFDIWAHQEDKAMVIEVKSSLGDMPAITLTQAEYQAADEYKENFVLAIVERLNDETPTVHMIANPIVSLDITQIVATPSWTIASSSWRAYDVKL